MLIICPKCFAKYEIDTTQFDEETHIFQCSSCGKRFEERVHFDDEKNENKQTVPPAYITEQPVLAPLSESDYIASNRATMNFSAQSSVVLPEEFTPVSDASIGWGRKLVFAIVALCMLGLVGLSAYVWMNKAVLLKKYPKVQKALALIMDDNSSPSLYNPNQNVTTLENVKSTLDVQEVVLTPIEQGVQEVVLPVVEQEASGVVLPPVEPVVQEPAQMPNESVDERILPVEVNNEVNESVQNVEVEPIIVDEPPVADLAVVSQDEVVSIDSKTGENAVLPEEQEIILEEVPIPGTDLVPSPVVIPTLAEPTVKDIQIRDVSFKYDQVDTQTRLFVQGVIFNVSDKTIKMPPLQVRLFDTNGALLGVKDLPYGEAQMPPQSDEFFFYELSDVPAGVVAKIEVVMKG